jgi:hypothetical protein
MRKLGLAGVFLTSFLRLIPTQAAPLHQWTIDEKYRGGHQSTYQKIKWQIPNIMRQTMINNAVKLGMNFRDGWQYPFEIKFVDDSPFGVENVLAYVQIYSDGVAIKQDLNINLGAYDREPFNFEKVFAHELTHAMLNDAIGAEATMILPVWLHEGLAVYAADQGETMVKSYAHKFSGFAARQMLNGLEGGHGALDYAEDYLAVKYIYAKHGPNSLHNFVREVIRRKGDVPGAIQYTCFESWEQFTINARAFAKEEIDAIGPPKRGQQQNPY